MKSGSGDVIGKRAYIYVLKSQLQEITVANFEEFAKTVVEGSEYSWFTIQCDDGTGIVFSGSDTTSAIYGILDDEDAISETVGFITRNADGSYTYEEAK